ncbi:MAG TPA: alanine-zipper protein [Solirubrobacterales bacterium]|nr:alanine-zipper protein [Solirubrobacterales bacterium]
MRKMLSKPISVRTLIVAVGLILTLTVAMPAVGASPVKLAKKALNKANKALNAANQAQTTANTANSTANQALTKANGIVPGPRAYGRVDGSSCATSSACPVDHSKGITGAREASTAGIYCVSATGLDQATDAWVATVDDGDTGGGGSDAQAQPNSNNAGCNAGEFEVRTTSISGGGNRTDVSFFIVIP